ncbi:MAG: FAD-binding oxidoreductase [Burkholderiaceae bacterium]
MSKPDLRKLRDAISGRVLVEKTDMAAFLTDWRGKWTGNAIAVVQPNSAEEVATVVGWCVDQELAVVPQGGNTGLSGGATPDESGRNIVLSLTRLNKVREIDPVNNTLTVEAGASLHNVQEAARTAGRLFPLSLAAEGSCTIGGNLATNAGGVQVLRYGNARDLCLGLEVVTPQGKIWSGLRGLRKDNTGYDLRDLYIGSEGTLGIITAAVLKLYPQPASRTVSWASVQNAQAATDLLQLARQELGAGLSAFELISGACVDLVAAQRPDVSRPLAQDAPWQVLLEFSDSEGEGHAETLLEGFWSLAFEQGLATDAVQASSLSQAAALWSWREDISESQAAAGPTIKHDISLPISRIADFIEVTGAELGTNFPQVRLVVFGHLGDGNLHYNLSPQPGASAQALADFIALEPALNQLVHDQVVAHEGSISAEHGLGQLRRDESARYKSAVELELMQTIRQALDPLGLMNPGKLLASTHN